MTYDVGGAPAPAETSAAPETVIDTEVVHTPNPISTETQVDTKPAPSIDDALDRAEAKVKADAAKEPVKTEAKADPVKRDETGKYSSDKPKEPIAEAAKAVETVAVKADPAAPIKAAAPSDSPARFSQDAKDAWATTPDPVKVEVNRAIKELEQGHTKYKTDAEAFHTIREFDEMAKRGGTDLRTALGKYVGMEQLLRQDNIKGLQAICDNIGIPLREVAAKILGQTPEENASQSDATIRELKHELAGLKQQLGGVTQHITHQRETSLMDNITSFAAKPENSRFDELADDIAFFLKSGRTQDLSEAYRLAERLNPAPAQATVDTKPTASSAAAIDLVAQTQKGSKSINGAPSSGSNPALRKPSKSLDESLDRAFAALG